MNGFERDSYQMDILARCDKNGSLTNVLGWHASVVALFTCDEHGVKVFSKDDAKFLNDTDPQDIDLVFAAIRAFNGLENLRETTKAAVGMVPLPPRNPVWRTVQT
jgi:hypothetical protein